MIHPFTQLQSEYESWVAHVVPNPDRVDEIAAVAARLTQAGPLGHYADVTARIAVPVVVQATICEREDGNDFTKSPAQGDPWDRPSIHVPRGRGPFTSWVDAAVDAWSVCDQLNVLSVPAWSLAYGCWKWEGYNGFGYRAHGRRTPYVLGGTNLQQPGKYVSDGSFDPNHMDTQLGALPVAIKMIELVPTLSLGDAMAMIPPPPSDPLPLPAGVGGTLTGTKWVQQSLNIVDNAGLLVDGNFGRQTRAAIRSFDQSHGLPPDGLITDELCTALDTALAANAAKS
jgi:lysozyme family protein